MLSSVKHLPETLAEKCSLAGMLLCLSIDIRAIFFKVTNRLDMSDELRHFPFSVQHSITTAIYAGNKIEAIKLYREASNCNLSIAKRVIDSLTQELRDKKPYVFKQNQETDKAGVAVILSLLFIIAGIGAWFLYGNQIDNFKNELMKFFNLEQQTSEPVVISENQKYHVISEPETTSLIEETITTTYPVNNDDGYSGMSLLQLYQQKLANPSYVERKSQSGLPKGFQNFAEEYQIKQVRANIAKELKLPPNQSARLIPLNLNTDISIDGSIQALEWQSALQIPLTNDGVQTTIYLQANKEWLFLAADVPADITAKGYDQFRFYFHVDIDPVIRNERIHVGRSVTQKLGGIRQTTIRWQGDAPKNNDERWKKYRISDWRIFQFAKGASTMKQHRQFEAKINLQESGLFVGSPFPVFIEIETDPIYENGKFKARQYLGKLGEQKNPIWLLIQ